MSIHRSVGRSASDVASHPAIVMNLVAKFRYDIVDDVWTGSTQSTVDSSSAQSTVGSSNMAASGAVGSSTMAASGAVGSSNMAASGADMAASGAEMLLSSQPTPSPKAASNIFDDLYDIWTPAPVEKLGSRKRKRVQRSPEADTGKWLPKLH